MDTPLAPEVENRQLIDAVLEAQDGQLKNAAEASSATIRRRIRENGFHRLIMPYKTVSDGDLNQLPNTELPVVVEEMEPDSVGAKTINFNDSADTAFYRGDKFVVCEKRLVSSFPVSITGGAFELALPPGAIAGKAFGASESDCGKGEAQNEGRDDFFHKGINSTPCHDEENGGEILPHLIPIDGVFVEHRIAANVVAGFDLSGGRIENYANFGESVLLEQAVPENGDHKVDFTDIGAVFTCIL